MDSKSGPRTYVPFIILSPGRTGSNLLMYYLRANPEVCCFSEVLNTGFEYVDYGVDGYDNYSAEDLSLRQINVTAFLRQRIFGEQPEAIRAVGFKAMYQHLAFVPGSTEELVSMPDLHVVHSKRQNLLRQFVSFRIAAKTGIWLNPIPAPGSPSAPSRVARFGIGPRRITRKLFGQRSRPAERKAVTITADECRVYFQWSRDLDNEYAERFRAHPVLDVWYEDIVSREQHTLGDVQIFLGVSARPLSTGTQRQNPEPLPQLITNYEELRGAFRDTEYAHFFDE